MSPLPRIRGGAVGRSGPGAAAGAGRYTRRRARRPGDPLARQPRRHRGPHPRPDRCPARGRHRRRTSSTATARPTWPTGPARWSSWAGRPRTAGSSTSPPSAARCSTSWPPGPSPSWSTTTTSPRPSCSQSWEPRVGYEVRWAGPSCSGWPPESRLAVADSAFNEAELIEAGYTDTAVVPLLIDMTATGGAARPGAGGVGWPRPRPTAGADFLFVGKVSPHKAPHDLVKMLAVYRRLYDPAARLHLVGSPLGERYGPALGAFVAELGPGRRRVGDRLGRARPSSRRTTGGRRLRVRLGPRGLLRAAGRGHGPRGAGGRLRRRPPFPRRWATPAWCWRQGAPALRRRRGPGDGRPRPAPGGWPGRPPGGWPATRSTARRRASSTW